MSNYSECLVDGLKAWDITLTDRQQTQFQTYLEEIKSWNKKINITALTEDRDILMKHFLDSLAATQYYPFSDQRIIDIGTGAGLPGLPIKILFPELSLTFVDSSAKKMRVLESICQKMGIQGCSFLNTNIEHVGRDASQRGTYDVVLSRAVAPANILLELSIPLLKVNGVAMLYKGPTGDEEVDNSVNALEILKAEIKQNACFSLPFTDFERKIIVVEKVGITPLNYPRNVGIPKKRPL